MKCASEEQPRFHRGTTAGSAAAQLCGGVADAIRMAVAYLHAHRKHAAERQREGEDHASDVPVNSDVCMHEV
jgi:hypothetical protein